MPKQSSSRMTERQRAESRRQDRERLQLAARELLSSEGWARWVKTRAMFHAYSAMRSRAVGGLQSVLRRHPERSQP